MAHLAVRGFLFAGVLIVACSGGDDSALHDEDEDVLSSEQGLPKPRGVNGATDYCNNPAAPCLPGEGDCDTQAQCVAGAVCAANVGRQFFFSSSWDICLPPHCVNGMLDADETIVDCGGACSAPGFDCASLCDLFPLGHASYCSPTCPCVGGEGDCDASTDCAAGFVCGRNNGPQFGLATGYDVCVPAHCKNRILDGDETFRDCGGSCSSSGFDCTSLCDRYPQGHSSHCSSDCRCGIGEGDCDSSAECLAGLVCQRGRGAAYGFSGDACIPVHCRNGVLDEGELGVDTGGECGGGSEGAVCVEGGGCQAGLYCRSDTNTCARLAQEGELCFDDNGCVEGLSCFRELFAEWSYCRRPGVVGGPCLDGSCEAGARCDSNMCFQVLEDFEPCLDCIPHGGNEPCICEAGLDCFPGGFDWYCQGPYAREGQRCDARPCGPRLHCDDIGGDFLPVCAPAGGLNQFCPDMGSCDPGLYCDWQTCELLPSEGQSCVESGACAGDLTCHEGVCTPREGQSCDLSNRCLPGLYCGGPDGQGTTCRRPAALGEPCYEVWSFEGVSCETGLYCSYLDEAMSLCRAPGLEGEACGYPLPSAGPEATGCAPDLYCASSAFDVSFGVCRPPGQAGETCLNPWADGLCAPGLVCEWPADGSLPVCQ